MRTTLAADRLEFALDEIRDAIRDIEGAGLDVEDSPDNLTAVMLSALKEAARALNSAQEIAEQRGVPRLELNRR